MTPKSAVFMSAAVVVLVWSAYSTRSQPASISRPQVLGTADQVLTPLFPLEALGTDDSGIPFASMTDWYQRGTGRTHSTSATYTGIYTIDTHGDDVYFAMSGERPFNGPQGGVVAKYSPNQIVQVLGLPDEEGINHIDFIPDYNRLFISGSDPSYGDGWDAGNLYIFDESTQQFTKIRNQLEQETLIAVTTTDSQGQYVFQNLKNTGYFVKVIPPTGYSVGPLGTNQLNDYNHFGGDARAFVCGPGTYSMRDWTNIQTDAGLVADRSAPPIASSTATPDASGFTGNSSIGDTVFEDQNADGYKQPDEPVVANVRLELYSSDPVFPCVLHAFDFHYEPNEGSMGALYYLTTIYAYQSPLYRSVDGGASWTIASILPEDRAYTIGRLEDTWYFTGLRSDFLDGFVSTFAKTNAFPSGWAFDSTPTKPVHITQQQDFLGQRIFISSDGNYLLASNNLSNGFTQHALPNGYQVVRNLWTQMASDGDYLYLATKRGALIRTADLMSYELLFDDPNYDIATVQYWPTRHRLLVGINGPNAGIYVIDLANIHPPGLTPVPSVTPSLTPTPTSVPIPDPLARYQSAVTLPGQPIETQSQISDIFGLLSQAGMDINQLAVWNPSKQLHDTYLGPSWEFLLPDFTLNAGDVIYLTLNQPSGIYPQEFIQTTPVDKITRRYETTNTSSDIFTLPSALIPRLHDQALTASLSGSVLQKLFLRPGKNYIAFNIQPETTQISQLFPPEAFPNMHIAIEDTLGNIYDPDAGVDQIGNIQTTQGYVVEITPSIPLGEVTHQLYGTSVVVLDQLDVPQGMSYVPYIGHKPVRVQDYFGTGLDGTITTITNQEGHTVSFDVSSQRYDYGFDFLIPGQSYRVESEQAMVIAMQNIEFATIAHLCSWIASLQEGVLPLNIGLFHQVSGEFYEMQQCGSELGYYPLVGDTAVVIQGINLDHLTIELTDTSTWGDIAPAEGVIDIRDYQAFSQDYPANASGLLDINTDGQVNVHDLLYIIHKFGTIVP